jgi:uncharacterized membrane protein
LSPSGRFVCDRCETTFDDASGRCPTCLRKSSVREARLSASEAARLAAGDHSQTSAARRATALWVAIALTAALAVVLSLAWAWLSATHLSAPALVAAAVAAAAFVASAVREHAGWADFARRCGIGAAVAAWAFVSGTIALVTTAGLSVAFTLTIAVVTFVGGLVPVLQWLRARDEDPARPSGKWR